MRSILRCAFLAMLFVCGSASAMTIGDLTIGKHEAGPNLAAKDLKGKVVFVIYWGTH